MTHSPKRHVDAARVAAHWNVTRALKTTADGAQMWFQLPAVQARANRLVSGREDYDWVTWACDTAFGPGVTVDRGLTLACGEGSRARELVQSGIVRHLDAYDIAPVAIERARQAALDEGIGDAVKFMVADANTLKLPPCSYDLVLIETGLHHFENLEGVYAQLHGALRPGGFLIINDYVGPPFFQFRRRQVEVMNAALRLLPLDLRALSEIRDDQIAEMPGPERGGVTSAPSPSPGRSRRQQLVEMPLKILDRIRDGSLPAILRRIARERLSGSYRWEITPPSRSGVIALDPSEAVRSDEILSLLATWFDIVEQRGYGGGLLHWLLDGIAGNFRGERGSEALSLLFDIEDRLTALGELQHDFVVVVARPKRLE